MQKHLDAGFAPKIVDQSRDPGPFVEAADIAAVQHQIGLMGSS